ncbi:Dam family site-specific DNA-(adenine-N6)-methyltransferase [Cetobacterium sp.]|uniref:Dam family site-specific DNA-(adenine-N6)-methyltransferase n=1 Tax=Cetobacterium sp. TaxID=2071632 RepID=UPI003EE5F7B1
MKQDIKEIVELTINEILEVLPIEIKDKAKSNINYCKNEIKNKVLKEFNFSKNKNNILLFEQKTLEDKEQKNIFFEIHNRRYLGAKTKLLEFIKEIISKECGEFYSFLDLFGGTGVVANYFNSSNKKIIINDLLKSNYFSYQTWFGTEQIDDLKLQKYINYFNNIQVDEDNYFSVNFGNSFFTLENARKIGFIREKIEELWNSKQINERERSILITSLIYALDKVANTCGHYDAFRKSLDQNKLLNLKYPKINQSLNMNNEIFNIDSNELVKKIKADVVYIDPPYNSRQYCDSYHLLENLAEWKKPKVIGKAKKMEDRQQLKSGYCSVKAPLIFKDLIENINAKYIIVSYNNMGNKGNIRSQAKISDTEILEILSLKGEVSIYEADFKYFSTGKAEIEDHKERLFVCKVKTIENIYEISKKEEKFIKSPLNYTGGKYKLLKEFDNIFPKNIDTFVDMFTGGANVAINSNAKNIIAIDNQNSLIELYNLLKKSNFITLEKKIETIIEKYNLSSSILNGYDYYNCNSSNGLGSFNKEGFKALRSIYNTFNFENEEEKVLIFFTLIIYAFNNQIRFNQKGQFNLPVGKRDFNSSIRKNLKNFIEALHSKNIKFLNNDFRKFDYTLLGDNDFIYFDPPYLITTATYNENNKWTEEEEKDLLQILDNLLNRNIKFALSNLLEVLSSEENKENTLLKNWINKNKNKIKVHYLNYSYKNSNYQKSKKYKEDIEILVTNF